MNSSGGRIVSNYENLKANGYKVGSIVRISVKNFCTFSACEVFPGPKLNIVIGPNGTGKSALTHAICLACGGKADDTGRSNNISAFVKIGSTGESYTEVDILSFDKTVKTIRREINADNKASKWLLDGRKSSQNEIKQLVAKLQIDVDNICSFMPQDRVGEFSRATPKKLLENTLMALENVKEFEISLIKEQMELSNIQGGRESLRRDRDLKQIQLETNRNELMILRNEMDRMQRREDALRLKSFYEVKLIKLELDQAVVELEKKEKEVVAAEAQKLIEEAKLAPIELEERNARKNSTLYDRSINEAMKKYQELTLTVRASMSRSEDLELEVESASSKLRSVDELKRDNEGKLHAARIDLRKYQHIEVEANEQIPLLTKAQEVITANISVCYDNQSKITNDINTVNPKTLQLRKQGVDLSKELENLQDFKQNYKKFLHKNDRMTTDSLSAMDWFSENEENFRSNNRIKGDVYGPMAMFCDVIDPYCAAMLENMVPANRLLGFIVQYDTDRDFLMKEFRRLNYEIDIVVMKNPEISNHRAFSLSQLDQLRDINIQGYLSDQIKCPDIIRSYLYIWHNVQSALWARPNHVISSISKHHMESLTSGHHKSFKLFVHCVKDDSITVYNAATSRFQSNIGYNSKGFVRKGYITSRKQSNNNVEEKRNELNSRIESSKKELSQKESELQQLRDQHRVMENKIQSYINERNTNRNKIKDFNQNREKIATRAKRVEDLEKILSVGVEKEKLEREGEYKIAVEALFKGIQKIADAVGKCNGTLIEKAICDKLKFEIEEKTRIISERLELAKRDLNNCQRDLNNKRRFRDDYRKKQADKEIELEQMIKSNFSISFEEFIEAKLEEMHSLCPEDTIEAVQARTVVLDHEIKRIVDNPLLKERFERLKAEISQQELLLEELNKQYESQHDILHERAEKWTRIVNACITKLNELFRKYMRDLNFDGEVLLRNKGLYNEYELQLRVRFRAESDMCDLDGHRHSGGERAVSTAMFLMALQDMTSSPFRVVDEINQGMDENNERLVFDRIVTSCVGDETRPQYFVATPKLLQSLNPMIHDDVTILLVLNGPGTNEKWDFHNKLLEIKRKATMITAVDDSQDDHMLSSQNHHLIVSTKKKLRT